MLHHVNTGLHSRTPHRHQSTGFNLYTVQCTHNCKPVYTTSKRCCVHYRFVFLLFHIKSKEGQVTYISVYPPMNQTIALGECKCIDRSFGEAGAVAIAIERI